MYALPPDAMLPWSLPGVAPYFALILSTAVIPVITFPNGEKTTGDQGNISQKGNAYLAATYPGLDVIKKATIVQ